MDIPMQYDHAQSISGTRVGYLGPSVFSTARFDDLRGTFGYEDELYADGGPMHTLNVPV